MPRIIRKLRILRSQIHFVTLGGAFFYCVQQVRVAGTIGSASERVIQRSNPAPATNFPF